MENNVVATSGDGHVFLCTDGATLRYQAWVNLMAESGGKHGIYVASYCTDGQTKDANFLHVTLMERIVKLVNVRGWHVHGVCTDNNSTEVKAMRLLKQTYEEKFKKLFIVLRCGMHTGGLLVEDAMSPPKKKKTDKHEDLARASELKARA